MEWEDISGRNAPYLDEPVERVDRGGFARGMASLHYVRVGYEDGIGPDEEFGPEPF